MDDDYSSVFSPTPGPLTLHTCSPNTFIFPQNAVSKYCVIHFNIQLVEDLRFVPMKGKAH